MRSLPPRLTARAWACGSAAPSLNRTGAACGLLTTLRAAQDFVSLYLPATRHATRLCLELALKLLTTLTPATRSLETLTQASVAEFLGGNLQQYGILLPSRYEWIVGNTEVIIVFVVQVKRGLRQLRVLGCWLQWNAATSATLCCHWRAAFPMHYYPAARCNPILPFSSKRSRLPNPAVRCGMAAPLGARGSKESVTELTLSRGSLRPRASPSLVLLIWQIEAGMSSQAGASAWVRRVAPSTLTMRLRL